MSNTFTCTIITPEAAVYEGDVTFAVVPAHDGEVGFLRDRAPFLVRLGIGSLRLEAPEGNQSYFVDGGFAEMVDNKLTILTEQAIAASDIEASTVQAELSAAEELPSHTPTEVDRRNREIARAKAKAKLTG